MPSASQLGQFLVAAGLLLSVALIVSMVSSGLHAVYKWFFVYICAGSVQGLVSLPFHPNTDVYAWIYFVSQPVIWLLYILIVLELYGLVLRGHRGIATLGRWTLLAALTVSVVVSLLSLAPDLGGAAGPHAILIYYTVVERGIVSSLVVFLLLITAFLIWYPIPLTRNVILHAIVYSVYFLSSTMALFIRNITRLELTSTISAVLLGIVNACLLVWVIFLSRSGETQTVVLSRQWHPQADEHLLKQIDSINAALLRTYRK